MILQALTLAAAVAGPPTAQVKVVTSLTTYGAIAREVVGDRGTVMSIAQGDEDPHYVQPKPSFIALLRDADLFVTTGLDLEVWVPALLDRAGNRRVQPGNPGYVAAFQGIDLMEVPASVDRSQGDIHAAGNPHIHTDPLNALLIARNVLAGLKRVDPTNAAYYEEREAAFEKTTLEQLIGPELVGLLTPARAFDLLRSEKLLSFLESTNYQGAPLATRLGGWLKEAAPLRGQEMACYHKEWSYFSRRFGIECVEYVEPKPGIPPSPGHVRKLIELMQQRHIKALFAANYYPRSQVDRVAERTGAAPVVVAENTHGAPGIETYADLVNGWLSGLVPVYH